MKKFLLILLCSTNIANAGFNGLTHHSRANCANNESISWDWTHDQLTWVMSSHYDARTGNIIHSLSSGWQVTWRNAMVHWGEGRGGWKVWGRHFMKDRYGNDVRVADEWVTDCAIYDGWWDKNK